MEGVRCHRGPVCVANVNASSRHSKRSRTRAGSSCLPPIRLPDAAGPYIGRPSKPNHLETSPSGQVPKQNSVRALWESAPTGGEEELP
jgi:hypothetical protein